jgi:EmrB/QacA subfamily drug resistance transporter
MVKIAEKRPTTTRPRLFTGLAVLCLAELIGVMDNTIVNVGLPTFARAFEASTTHLQWIVDAYTLSFAVFMLPGGYLGDRLGRRRVLLIGLVGFAAVSAVSALANDLTQLIALRAVLGFFAALLFPATLSLISTLFTGSRFHALAVGLWTATAGLAIALGPIVGGLLLRHFAWPSLFWINVAIVAPLLVATPLLVPRGDRAPRTRPDLVGSALVIVAVAALVGATIEGPRLGWTSVPVLAAFVVSALAWPAFVVWEGRVATPLLELRHFRDRAFAASSGAIALAFFSLFGFTFGITLYFQAVLGYSALKAGLAILPFAVVMAGFSPIAAVLAKRVGERACVSAGLALMGGGFWLVALADAESNYWFYLVPPMVLMAAGLALVQGPATDVIMAGAPRDAVGVFSAVNDSLREVGGTVGVAVLGSVLAHRYQAGMRDIVASDPALAGADGSIVAAQQLAQALPREQAADVVRTATDAFLAGLHANCWLLGIAGIGAGLAAWLVFPRTLRVRAQTTMR